MSRWVIYWLFVVLKIRLKTHIVPLKDSSNAMISHDDQSATREHMLSFPALMIDKGIRLFVRKINSLHVFRNNSKVIAPTIVSYHIIMEMYFHCKTALIKLLLRIL